MRIWSNMRAVATEPILFCSVVVAAVGVLDAVTGIEVSVSSLYLVPVIFGAWRRGAVAGLLLAILSALSWIVADIYDGHTYSAPWIVAWNGATLLVFLCATALSVSAVVSALARERDLAYHDHLTGLWNSRAFHRLSSSECSRAARAGEPVTIAYLDLDDFKLVNDTLGHLGADEILRRVGTALRSTVRTNDIVGRLGGDEFAMMLGGMAISQAEALLSRVLTAVQEATRDAGFVVTFSIGAVATTAPGPTLEALLRSADKAMYEAKNGGKNKVVVGLVS